MFERKKKKSPSNLDSKADRSVIKGEHHFPKPNISNRSLMIICIVPVLDP